MDFCFAELEVLFRMVVGVESIAASSQDSLVRLLRLAGFPR